MATRSKADVEIFERVLAEFNHCCAGCGSGLDLERDHVHPRSAGGTDDPSNLQVLCHHCNNKKNGLVGIPRFDPRTEVFDTRIIAENRSVYCHLIDGYR